jgi:16S rRNA processing protein RimM
LSPEPGTPDRWVVLGKIGAAFGVQGWVRITSYTDPPENILDYETWYVQRAGQWQAVEIEDGRMTAKGVQVKLAGIDTPEVSCRRLRQASTTGAIWKDWKP